MTANHLGSSSSHGPNVWSFNGYQYGIYADDLNDAVVTRTNRTTRAMTSFKMSTIPGNPLSLPLDNADEHESLGIAVDPNGIIHVAGNNWQNNVPRIVRSTNPENITAWTNESAQLVAAAGTTPTSGATSYIRWAQLRNGDLFMMQRCRNEWGGVSNPGVEHIYVMRAGESTWLNRGPVIAGDLGTEDAFYRTHHHVDENGRIHLFGAWDQSYAGVAVDFHSYLYSDDDAVSWKSIDGTALTLPISKTSASGIAMRTGVGIGLANNLYAMGCAVDGNNYPACFYILSGVIRLVRWNGSAWTVTTPYAGIGFHAMLVNFRDALWVLQPQAGYLLLRRIDAPQQSIRIAATVPNSWAGYADQPILRDTGVLEVYVRESPAAPRIFQLGRNPRISVAPTTYSPSVDATGLTDVSAGMAAFVASVPNGGIIELPSTAMYLMDSTLEITGRFNLTVNANGAQFKTTPGSGASARPNVRVEDSVVVLFRDLIVNGANPSAGTGEAAYVPAKAGQHGFEVLGSALVTISDCSAYDVYGDFLNFGGDDTTTGAQSVTVDRFVGHRNGRYGVGFTHGSGVVVQDCEFREIRRSVMSLEPSGAVQSINTFVFQNNTIENFRLNFVACRGENGVDGVTIYNNTVNSAPSSLGTMLILVQATDSTVRSNWSVTDNVCPVLVGNPQQYSQHYAFMDNLVVTGNVQPSQAGLGMYLARLWTATNYNVSGNDVGVDGVGQFVYGSAADPGWET